MRWIAAVAVCLAMMATARADDDWGARRDPFDPGVVQRYKANLARDPHHDGSLRQLIALYRRYRTVAKLEAEYRARLGASEDWAALVVLARLPRSSRAETLALWKRAVVANPNDARGWLAFGDASHADTKAAREAYQRAATLARSPVLQRTALTKLVNVAFTAGDHRAVDEAYAALIVLAPKDGKLWLDRGNAQLAAKQFAAARDSFVKAESLLRTDPERRLTAMTSQGTALAAMGKADEAIAQYERTLAQVPAGFFLAQELVTLVVDIERRRKRMPAAIAWLEKRWPARRRGHFEHAMLGDLHAENGDDERALVAYRRAVARAPTEVVTQRKLIALLDKVRPTEALAQHEAAARVAPGDADLQIALARRYRTTRAAKALAVLAALSRRMGHDVRVRSSIAELYEEWDELALAIKEYEAIARLEPKDIDHAIVLGEAYWRADDPPRALAAWNRLDKIATREAWFRKGEVLAMHELWGEAATAFGKSLAIDPTNADALYGRARALDELQRFPEALEDARRAVALTGQASHTDGLRNRQLLVRVYQHWNEAGDKHLSQALARWRFAFDRGDAIAGYLLAAHHARISSHQQHDVLVQLYRQVPTDDSLGIVLARSFMRRRDFDRARVELERIAKRTPARADEIGKLLVQVEEDRARAEQEMRWEEEGRARALARSQPPDLVGRDGRTGMRLALGADVDNTSSALLGLGGYRTYRLARATGLAIRIDWLQRDDEMEEVNAFAIAGTFSRRVVDARKFELAIGAGPGLELRYGSDARSSSWNRGGLTGDVTLELLPRALPATLGARLHHNLTDSSRGSALLLELGFELR